MAIPLVEPFRISSGEVRLKESLLLRVEGEGAFGWGESSAMPGAFYSKETPGSCQQSLLDALLPAVVGRRFESVIHLESCLRALSSNRFARVAVETAAFELIAFQQNLSVRELLGLPAIEPIPCGLAIGLYDREADLIAAIHRHWPGNYQRLKIKIEPGHDIAPVRAVRAEFGEIPLFVDANAAYTRNDFPTLERLDGYGLMMIEQPLAKDDMDGAALLQRRLHTPVCLDESVETAADARRAIGLGACRIVNIKLQRVGGFLEALRIMKICTEAGISLWLGTMPELGVGTAQLLALAGHSGIGFPTDAHPSSRWFADDVLKPEIKFNGGGLRLPAGPGLGYEVDESKVSRFRVNTWRMGAAARPLA
ncbi:MAG: o-succinylbenzoate synthase [Terriglobia bacterium]